VIGSHIEAGMTRGAAKLWNEFCFFGLALILTFSPWEKEQPSPAPNLADNHLANPAAGFLKRPSPILSLFGGGTV
jgi:hypothetical protein